MLELQYASMRCYRVSQPRHLMSPRRGTVVVPLQIIGCKYGILLRFSLPHQWVHAYIYEFMPNLTFLLISGCQNWKRIRSEQFISDASIIKSCQVLKTNALPRLSLLHFVLPVRWDCSLAHSLCLAHTQKIKFGEIKSGINTLMDQS